VIAHALFITANQRKRTKKSQPLSEARNPSVFKAKG
jgi:hypothetical protein